jgi:hypothetical protein
MKSILLLISLLLFACENKPKTQEQKTVEIVQKEKPNVIKNKAEDWQLDFGLTHNIDKDSIWNKPVRYYIENKKCSQTAIEFYYGKYRPTDEEKTKKLLSLVTTENSELRPFYRWILNKTIVIQDGALAEYTGEPARQYAEKFPNEFFEYMNFDKSGEKYSDWCNSITYSGFYDTDNFEKHTIIRKEMIKTMTENCRNCNREIKMKIKLFANDCFPDSNKMH